MRLGKNRFLLKSIYIVLQLLLIIVFLHKCKDANLSRADHEESWKFIVYGDTAANDANHRAVLQAIMNYTPDYKFIINVGDVVANGELLDDWYIWQQACDDILGGTGQYSIPPEYMAAPGNHDMVNTPQGLANWLTFLYGQAQQFGNDGVYFNFDYKNARFVILNSNYFSSSGMGPQYDMMMEVIQNNPKEWLFAFWHHPIFDFGPKQYRDDIHDAWGIPLYQYKCNIIFVGHAHFYVRTKKLELNGEMNPPLDPVNGTVQIVTGNGGIGLSDLDPNKDGNAYMIESCQDEYHGYCEITVDGEIVHLRHILADGTVFDEKLYASRDNNR
jgi:hypothetical protein